VYAKHVLQLLLEELVDLLELAGFFLKVPVDVGRCKDVLEVHPVLLDDDDVIDDLRDAEHSLLESLGVGAQHLQVVGAEDIVERGKDLV